MSIKSFKKIMFSAFLNQTKSSWDRKPEIQSVLCIENKSILTKERTFYDLSFLSYHRYLNQDTQTEKIMSENDFTSRFKYFQIGGKSETFSRLDTLFTVSVNNAIISLGREKSI